MPSVCHLQFQGGDEDCPTHLFADVSEFQVPLEDSYPYRVLSIWVCDGTCRDYNFARNYAWMRTAFDDGRLTFGIVYTYVRSASWRANADTVQAMFAATPVCIRGWP